MVIFLTQVGHPNFRGGGNAVAHEFSGALSRAGHRVTAIFLAPPQFLKIKPATDYGIIILKQSKNPFLNCLKVHRLIKKLRKGGEEPDVVISLGYEGLLIPWLKNLPFFVAGSHNFLRPISFKTLLRFSWIFPWNWGKFLYELQRLLDYFTKRRASAVQALCIFGKKQLKEIYGISEKNIFIVPNGVNAPLLKTKNRTSEKNILFMGGSSYHKGLDVLLKALPEVLKENPTAKVFVLGEMKREERELRLLAEKLDVMAHVLWRGLVSREEMPGFYEKTYVSVFPSRLDTFPLGILESMACGIPVIATRVGGIPEIIEEGITGLMIPPEDPGALVRALNSLLSDPGRANKISEQEKKIANARFGWEGIAKIFENEINARLA